MSSPFPILAIDVGTRRIGLAVMDKLASCADFKEIKLREGNKALDRILGLLKEHKIKTLVAGLPLGAQGQRTKQCDDVENFCRRIEKRSQIKAIYVDEFLTSYEANQSLRVKQSQKIDDRAAEIILIRFLIAKGLLPDYL